MKTRHRPGEATVSPPEVQTSRIPGFYRLSIEQRLAFLARAFQLSDRDIEELRSGSALKIDHAVNMVENAIGVLGLPLGLGLNFLVDGREYLVPMAIEEASIIAAASKAALMIREGGGFRTQTSDPVMIGQVQVLDLDDPAAAAERVKDARREVVRAANLANPRMLERGGGVFDLETRIVDGGPDIGPMLIVHLLFDVREAMGANAVNAACEAAGPEIARVSGGRVNLRILSNLADRRIARAEFTLPFGHLAERDMSGAEVAHHMVEAGRMAWVDPYRATTHNKGIFNGICAAALAMGQDWRAIEAGGHAYAARSGAYRSLTRYWIEGEALRGSIELPLQVGWVGGAVNSHPGVRVLRKISGVANARELSSLLASVGLAQNFAACLALGTVGIQKGHMALHARSIALSVGVPPEMVDDVTSTMLRRGAVSVTQAEEIFREMTAAAGARAEAEERLGESFAPGKVVLFGEHATVYNHPGISASLDLGLRVRLVRDPDGPRFLNPDFRKVFPVVRSDEDLQLFSRAADVALEMYELEHERMAIRIESDLIPGMGLGSSAAFSVALCSALRGLRMERAAGAAGAQGANGAAPRSRETRGWDASLFEDAQRLESIFHGHPSGMDTATVLSGGVVWFRKGPPREMLPMRLPAPVSGVICIVEPGARTIDMVRRVAEARERDRTRIDALLREIGNLTVDAGIALGTGDIAEAGLLMSRNHEILAELGVSTPALDRAVSRLVELGALGAKLTGSGGGGAVVSLVNPETQYTIVRELTGEFPLVVPFTIGGAAR